MAQHFSDLTFYKSIMRRCLQTVFYMHIAFFQCVLTGLADDKCEGKYKNCCEGFKFDFQSNTCVECEIGFYETNCSSKCPKGTFGKGCQQNCNCSLCHHANGCEIKNYIMRTTHNDQLITGEASSSTNGSPISVESNIQSNDSGDDTEQQTLLTHHGLYAIVSTNTLLTLPITVAVVIYICRKRKNKKNRLEDEPIIYYQANADPVYNTCNLNRMNNNAKGDVYDALSVYSEEGSQLNVSCLEDTPRKARANSYVPVRERKPKENDELATEKAEYTQVKKVNRRAEDVELGHSMTVDSLESSSLTDNRQSTEDIPYIEPLVPATSELGRNGLRSLRVSTLGLPMEDSEKISIGSVVYTELE